MRSRAHPTALQFESPGRWAGASRVRPARYSGRTLVVTNRVVMDLVAEVRWGAVFLDTFALDVVFLALILVGFFVAIRYHPLSMMGG